MDTATFIQPNSQFIRDVIASGGGDLKKCYQCGTCSVTCDLSPDLSPFPRKQMLAAQWGLKDRVTSDPAIWLCHNCGKCTERCPRGARPGDVLNALRAQAVRRFAFPRFMGELTASPRALAALFLVAILVVLGVMSQAPPRTDEGPLEFADLFPIATLEVVFFTVSALALIAFTVSLWRFARAAQASEEACGLMPALGEIAVHERFRDCEDSGMRNGHLLTMWGFIGLGGVGTVIGVGTMAGVMTTPLELTNPLKIFANVAAVAALAGVVMLLVRRTRDPARRHNSSYFDWFFLLVLATAVFTGILAEVFRLLQTNAMYGVYFVHLVLVFVLLLYAPYSKFAHLGYRTVAMAVSRRAKRTDREKIYAH